MQGSDTVPCAGCTAVETGIGSIPFTLMVKSIIDLTLDTL